MANFYENNKMLMQVEVVEIHRGLEVLDEYRVTIVTDQGQINYRNIGPSRLIDLLKVHIFNLPSRITIQRGEATIHNLPS